MSTWQSTTRSSTTLNGSTLVEEPSTAQFSSCHRCADGACGRSGGWAAMARTVREFDEEKVKECKEDMDTLLVFAGLFSAVLTAFVIESYQNLQEDVPSQILLVLRHMANQPSNSSCSPLGPYTSTADTVSSSPFQPSATDVLVNGLWFASLILSLVTASFGMLVKQWLREYLAVEYPSPQARLRIRHHRYPELKKWNVFNIAAILPLLLQISLGLFFLGLCYFTASANTNVGHTTIPLVSGWAFCFSMTTLLPTFFPRCPYKLFFLKDVLRTVHIYVQSVLKYFMAFFTRLYNRTSFGTTSETILARVLGLDSESHGQYERNVHLDEEKVALDESRDLDIIAAVDALQSNDELLGTTILESLGQVQPNWQDLVKFVLRTMGHRLQLDHLSDLKPAPLDLTPLTRRGRTAIVDIIASHWDIEMRQQSRSKRTALHWQESDATMAALFILVSPSRFSLPESGIFTLKNVLFDKEAKICFALSRRCPWRADENQDRLPLLIRGFTGLLNDLDPRLEQALLWFEALLVGRFSSVVPEAEESKVYTIRNAAEWPWSHAVPRAAIKEAAGYLIRVVCNTLRKVHANYTRISPGMHDALRAMFYLVSLQQEHLVLFSAFRRDSVEFRAIIHESLADQSTTAIVVQVIMDLPAIMLMEPKVQWGFRVLNVIEDHVHDTMISSELTNLREFVTHAASDLDSPMTIAQVIRLSYVTVQMVAHVRGTVHSDLDISEVQSLTSSLTAVFDAFRSQMDSALVVHPEDSTLAESCLNTIQRMTLANIVFDAYEDNETGYAGWQAQFNPQETLFDDDFISMLAQIYADPIHARRFYRVRRIADMYNSKLQSGSTDS